MATAGAGAETTQNEIGSDKTSLVPDGEGKHDEVWKISRTHTYPLTCIQLDPPFWNRATEQQTERF